MKAASADFKSIVESVYSLPLEFRVELKNLLERNIADDRRNEIANNYKAAQKEQKSGKVKFSSSISELKTAL